MRDSLLNNYSGEFSVVRLENYIDNIDSFISSENSLNVVRYRVPGRVFPTLHQLSLTSLTPTGGIFSVVGEINSWLHSLNSIVNFSNYKISIEGRNIQQTGSVTRFNVTESLSQVTNNYPVFAPDTRMIFDWVKMALIIVRPNGYIAFTKDEETGVAGWQRGNMCFSDVVYLKSLKFNLPEKQPAIFGIEGNSILMNVEGLQNRDQGYLSNLPNCLDEHILINTSADSIDLSALKTFLMGLGYQNTDRISIATVDGYFGARGGAIANMLFSELTGTVETLGRQNFIVGKPFTSSVVSWAPVSQFRRDRSLKGAKYKITQFILYAIYNTEFNIDGQPIGLKTPIVQQTYIDTVEPYDYYLKTEIGYDPHFALSVSSPFPMAFTGWSLDIAGGD